MWSHCTCVARLTIIISCVIFNSGLVCVCSGRCIRTLTGGNGKLSSLVWDEVHVISAHQSSSIKLWDFHPTQH